MSNGSEHIDEGHRDDLDETHVAYLTEGDVALLEFVASSKADYLDFDAESYFIHDEDDAE